MTDRKFTYPTEFPAHYVTRDGREAVVLGINPNNEYSPLVGHVGELNMAWPPCGCLRRDWESCYDLFDKPAEVVEWINDYVDEAGGTYGSRLEADQFSSNYKDRIAVYRRTMIDGKVVKIEIEETF